MSKQARLLIIFASDPFHGEKSSTTEVSGEKGKQLFVLSAVLNSSLTWCGDEA